MSRPPRADAPPHTMRDALAARLRTAFPPVAPSPDARIAALCEKIAAIGEDRRATPFRPHPVR